MEKYDLLPEQLLYEGTLTEANFFKPTALTDQQILLTHSSDYLSKLMNLTLSRKEERNIGFPVKSSLISRGRVISGGTYECALHALEQGVAMNIAGGTHHAFADRGEGFCILNDMAIASNLLLHQNLVQKVLFIDLDVHQGNGNAALFHGDERVFTFSMHGAKNYPLRKEQSDWDVGLPDGMEDKPYLSLLANALPRLMDTVAPDIIFYQAGVDILSTDKLGRLSITTAGCRERDKMVLKTALQNSVPIVISMGGGYSIRIADIIESHANTFRTAQEIYF